MHTNCRSELLPIARGEPVETDLPIEAMLENQRTDRPQGMERFVSGMFRSERDQWTREWLWKIGMQTPTWAALETLRIYVDLDVVVDRGRAAAVRRSRRRLPRRARPRRVPC